MEKTTSFNDYLGLFENRSLPRNSFMGLTFPIGFAFVNDNAAFSTDFLALAAVFSGIIMCKIVYDLTGYVSLLYFKAYGKLSNAAKVEWNNRGYSTLHAIVVVLASLYLLLLSDLFSENSSEDLFINRASIVSNTVLGISIGYFLADMVLILWNFPALGGLEYMLHHGLSLLSLLLAVISGQAQFYILLVLVTESTTPFVNLRWYLDVSGLKNSKIYVFNGIALFLGWLVARVLLFIFFFIHMFVHFDQVKQVFPMGFYSLLLVPPTLSAMNLVWFGKITKGLIKTLSKARRSE